MSLLEQLRRGKMVPVNHPYTTTRKRARTIMNLIIEHKSEFPSKLRPAITIAASKCRPGIFVAEIYIAATYFFFGRYRELSDLQQDLEIPNSASSQEEWYGLDSEVDTNNQAELIIRLFPWKLKEELLGMPSSRGQIPIFAVASNPKAVSFVPLFASLGAKLGVFSSKQDPTGLNWSGENGSALKQLFIHTLTQIESGTEPTTDLDEKSLAMLMRLREMGFCSKANENHLMWWLFTAAQHRDAEFIQSRLRLLVRWNPSILKCSSSQRTNLLRNFLYHCKERQTHHESYALEVFRGIVELGMLEYPQELGFLFHKTCSASGIILIPDNTSNCDTNFGLACHLFGTDTVTTMVDDALLKPIGFNTTNNLRTLLVAASANPKISTEGVFTLLRRDPMAMLS